MSNMVDSNSTGISAACAQAADAATDKTDGAATDRGLDALLSDLSALQAAQQSWPEQYKLGAEACNRAVDELNGEAFRRLIRSLKSSPQLAATLREAVADEVVYSVLRRHKILKPSLFERVQNALDTIRPMLESHGGNVELVSVEAPLAQVRFIGACDGCPASSLTFYSGVKQAIVDHVPEITEIRQIKGLDNSSQVIQFSSPFARYENGDWLDATTLQELADGQTLIKNLETHSVLLSRFGDKVSCFENACSHMGMAMDGGEIGDGLITCPYHGFQYSLDSGECLTAPQVQLQPHGVRVVGELVQVQLTR